jgi:hypothetical protein
VGNAARPRRGCACSPIAIQPAYAVPGAVQLISSSR